MDWMKTLCSACCGAFLRMMVSLLYVWMVCSIKSTLGVKEGRKAQPYERMLSSSGEGNITPASSIATSQPTCWIFVHLQKAGGTTVKTILKRRWKEMFRVCDTAHWLQGDDVTREAAARMKLGKPHAVAAGGYTEGLRRDVGDSCKWFVVFRHPISRLVSAYFYCKVIPNDPLCSSTIVQARTSSLQEFAEHWGNFGLR